jgi:hypothetical protein
MIAEGMEGAMDSGTAISVKYWIASDQGRNFRDLDGIDEFRRELTANYISVVKGRPAGAGGFTHLYVEIISSFSLSHLVQLVLDGIAFDLIKRGSESFVLRPFLEAYKKLRDRNKGTRLIDIGELQIHFQDSVLLIHEVSADTMVPNLERLLLSLAQNYEHLTLSDGESPFLIHIPVFEDPEDERPCRFRVRGDIDETIRSDGPADYFKFWGLEYIVDTDRRVYDVARQLLLDERFNTLEEHWAEWTRRAEAKYRQRTGG